MLQPLPETPLTTTTTSSEHTLYLTENTHELSLQSETILFIPGASNEETRLREQQKEDMDVVLAHSRGQEVGSGTAYDGEVIYLDPHIRPEYYNCVITLRLFRPDYPQGGNVNRTPIFTTSQEPTVGSVAVQANHVSYVLEVKDTVVIVKEGNFKPGRLTERAIPRKAIIGYYN